METKTQPIGGEWTYTTLYTKTEMLKMKHDEGIIIYDFHKFEKNINNY